MSPASSRASQCPLEAFWELLPAAFPLGFSKWDIRAAACWLTPSQRKACLEHTGCMISGPRVSSCINPEDSAQAAPPRGRHGGSSLVEGPPSGWRQRWRWPGFLLLPAPAPPRVPGPRPPSLAAPCCPHWPCPQSGLGHSVFLMVLPACGSAFMASWLLSFKGEESSDSRFVCGGESSF